MWSVARGDVQCACFCSASARRILPASFFSFRVTVGVLSEYIFTCLCLRGNSTPSITIHPKINPTISKSEIDRVTFRFFYFISDSFTSGFHPCLHIIGSKAYVPPIHTCPYPPPYASINAMYYGSPGIISMHFVGSLDGSCSSCRILSAYCVADVDF